MPNCPECGVFGGLAPPKKQTEAQPKKRKTLADAPPLAGLRVSTGILGLDRVLGIDWRTKKCGLHIPSSVLFAGAAGCGKSTLLLQMCARLATKRFLYLSSEQTLSEIKDNAERLGLTPSEIAGIEAERVTELSEALERMHEFNPQVVIIDSLNELVDSMNDTPDVQMNMIRTTTALKEEAEKNNRGIFLITHMNKKEEISGVQRIQHIVSAVMHIEMEPKLGKSGRILQCPKKNRFGSTSTISRFMMTEHGLEEASDEDVSLPMGKPKMEDV